MIYLDHAATTPVSAGVRAAMMPFLTEQYGNASAVYGLAQSAREAVEKSRRIVAEILHAESSEIIFTGGGSESDNAVFFGTGMLNHWRGHVITDAVEHDAVLRSAEFLREMGVDVTVLPVDNRGMVDPEEVRKALRPDTFLISIMYANNEIGTLEPVREIAAIAKERQILFHTDAVQALGHEKLDLSDLQADFLSASAHKLNGPKGVGLLYIRRGISLPPLIRGGRQEKGRRAGTENTAGIVGFSEALKEATDSLSERQARTARLRDRLESAILSDFPDAVVNGDRERRLVSNLNVTFPGAASELLLAMLDEAGIAASAGSACESGALEPSHVLLAIGKSQADASSSIRFSLGHDNTEEEIDTVSKTLREILTKLR